MGWYNASWGYRVCITVESGYVVADLSDFPVYVDLSDLPAGFHSNVNQTDARDIRVTTSDGTTEVPSEVVFYDSANDTGELHFKGSLSSSTDTDFYIYFGNASATAPAASSTYGSQNVWNSNYKVVTHNGGGSDSTSNGHNGTPSGVTAGDKTGKLGKATEFAQDYDSFDLGSTVKDYIEGNQFTVSVWCKPASSQNELAGPIGADRTQPWAFTIRRRWYIQYMQNGVDLDSTQIFVSGEWIYITAVFNSSVGRKLYVNNNSAVTDQQKSLAVSNNDAFIIGYTYAGGARSFLGDIDEIRISNIDRSSDWISTEYNNQNAPDTFYSVGSISFFTMPRLADYYRRVRHS